MISVFGSNVGAEEILAVEGCIRKQWMGIGSGVREFDLSDHPNPANDDHPKTGQRRTTIRVAFSDRLD